MKTIEEYMTLPYVRVIIPDEDMEGKACYRAEHPELPGCMSHGKTPLEAVQNLADARRLYIQTRLELGQNVPEPAVPTVGTSFSLTQAIVLANIDLMAVVVPATPDTTVGYQTNLPTSYDVMAKQAA